MWFPFYADLISFCIIVGSGSRGSTPPPTCKSPTMNQGVQVSSSTNNQHHIEERDHHRPSNILSRGDTKDRQGYQQHGGQQHGSQQLVASGMVASSMVASNMVASSMVAYSMVTNITVGLCNSHHMNAAVAKVVLETEVAWVRILCCVQIYLRLVWNCYFHGQHFT